MAAVAALAISLSLPQGIAVLCVGSDGRVALELAAPSIASATTDAGARALVSDVGSCPCGDDCGPCTDTPLGAGNVFIRLQRAPQILVPLAAAMTTCGVAAGAPPPSLADSRPAGAPVSDFPSSGTRLRTIVLLI